MVFSTPPYVALKYTRIVRSNTADPIVRFESNVKTRISNLAASGIFEILRQHVFLNYFVHLDRVSSYYRTANAIVYSFITCTYTIICYGNKRCLWRHSKDRRVLSSLLYSINGANFSNIYLRCQNAVCIYDDCNMHPAPEMASDRINASTIIIEQKHLIQIDRQLCENNTSWQYSRFLFLFVEIDGITCLRRARCG